MKINKLYVYGCSISSPYWMRENDAYPYLVSKELNCPYVRRSETALCHNETFNRFTNDLNLFKKDDLIIYQFTAGDREGYKLKNDLYLTSALLSEDLNYFAHILNTYGKGRINYNVSDKQLITLLDYIEQWGKHTYYYKYHRVINLLEFLKEKIGINYLTLFLSDDFEKYNPKNSIKFPIEKNENNLSIQKWVYQNKWTLNYSKPKEAGNDQHPDERGHLEIANKIISYINDCK